MTADHLAWTESVSARALLRWPYHPAAGGHLDRLHNGPAAHRGGLALVKAIAKAGATDAGGRQSKNPPC